METQQFVTFRNDSSEEESLTKATSNKENKTERQQQAVQAKPFVTFKNSDSGKDAKFLLLLTGTDPDDKEEYAVWEICEGRQEAYNTIKAYIESLDLIESTIVVESEPITSRKRIIDFLIYVLDSGKIEDPGFDPMDYVDGDIEEEADIDMEEE